MYNAWFQRWKNKLKRMFKDIAPQKKPTFNKNFKACASCGKFVPANATSCEYCGSATGHIQVKPSQFEGQTNMDHLETTFAVFGVCTFLFAITAILSYREIQGTSFGLMDLLMSQLAPSGEHFLMLGATSLQKILLENEYWRVMTYMFLHGNIIHIIFNFSCLAFLGPLIYNLYGTARFWVITLTCGAIAGLATTFINAYVMPPAFASGGTVGFSGVIFGYIGALFAYYKGSGDLAAADKFRSWMIWGNGLCILITLLGMPIDNVAHLGGMFCGLFVGRILFQFAAAKWLAIIERTLLIVLTASWLYGMIVVFQSLLSSLRGAV